MDEYFRSLMIMLQRDVFLSLLFFRFSFKIVAYLQILFPVNSHAHSVYFKKLIGITSI